MNPIPSLVTILALVQGAPPAQNPAANAQKPASTSSAQANATAPAAEQGSTNVTYLGGQPMPTKQTIGALTLEGTNLTFKGGGAAISVPFQQVTKLRYGRIAFNGVDKSLIVPEMRDKPGRRRTVVDVQFTHKNTTSHLLIRLPPKNADKLLAQIETKTGKKAERAKSAGDGKAADKPADKPKT
jgi:hypothetical protein